MSRSARSSRKRRQKKSHFDNSPVYIFLILISAAVGLGWHFLGEHTARTESNTVANLDASLKKLDKENPQSSQAFISSEIAAEPKAVPSDEYKVSLYTSSKKPDKEVVQSSQTFIPSGTTVETKAVLPEKNFDFLANYCLNCHDAEKEEGEVNLEDLDFHITTIEQAELWQSVLNAINSGEMPPKTKSSPRVRKRLIFLRASPIPW